LYKIIIFANGNDKPIFGALPYGTGDDQSEQPFL